MPKTPRTPLAALARRCVAARNPATAALTMAALATAMSLFTAAPAGAASHTSYPSLEQQLQTAQAKRSQAAARLNALKATDAQLADAVTTLDRQVKVQAASVDSARVALKAALDAADAADARVASTQAQIGGLRDAVVGRAVAAYTDSTSSLSELLISKDLNAASQRSAFLDEINGRNQDALDSLRAALQDLSGEQGAAAKARQLASKRRHDAESYLASLAEQMSAKSRLSAALGARIAAQQQESDAMAAQESSIESLIQGQQNAVFAASRGPGGVANGRVSGSGLIWPCSGPITSPFGMRWGRMHEGVDIGCGEGTPIHDAKAGVVIFSGQMSGYGNVIIIDHGGGFSTLYAHESRLSASQGEQVGQGQVIGFVGATGDATGPHLHFETRVNGTPQNPMQYLP